DNPILFDASCSGIQHLSAMTRDIEIARKVNIIPEEHLKNEDDDTILDKSTGQDYYLYAAKKVQIHLDNSDNIKFNNILLTRELVKRTIMTIHYNVTIFGVKNQLLENIKPTKIDDKTFFILNPNLTNSPSGVLIITQVQPARRARRARRAGEKDKKIMYLLPTEFLKFVDIVSLLRLNYKTGA